jgi:hypothetical protein
MQKRNFSTGRYIEAFIVTLSIFALGVFLGYYISEIRIKEMFLEYEELRLKISGAMLETKILEDELCKYDVLGITGNEKVELGREVERLETLRGKTDKDVLRLKEEYELLSINQMLLVGKWKEECNKNISIIIFFYSNLQNVTESENQGFVLDYVYEKHPNKVSIYAYDMDIENPAITTLKRKYGIVVVPTLVINGEVCPGFQSKERIESLI